MELELGDKLVSVKINDQTKQVKYYREMIKLLKNVKPGSSVILNFKLYDAKEDKLKGEFKTVELKSPIDVDALGIRDSQITISHYKKDKSGQLLPGDMIVSWNGRAYYKCF